MTKMISQISMKVGLAIIAISQSLAMGDLNITLGTRDVTNGGSNTVMLQLFSDDLTTTLGSIPLPVSLVGESSLMVTIPNEYLGLSRFRITNGADGWAMAYIELTTSAATLRVDEEVWIDNPNTDTYDRDAFTELTWGNVEIVTGTRDTANGQSNTAELVLVSAAGDDSTPISLDVQSVGENTQNAGVRLEFLDLVEFAVINANDGWAMDYIELNVAGGASARVDENVWIDNPVEGTYDAPAFTTLSWGALEVESSTRNVNNAQSSTVTLVLYSDNLQATLSPISLPAILGGEAQFTTYVRSEYLGLRQFRILNGNDGWAMNYLFLSTYKNTVQVDGPVWVDNPASDSYDTFVVSAFTFVP